MSAAVQRAAVLDGLVLTLIEASHQLAPDRLPELLDEEAAGAGLSARIYLADHELRELIPFPRGDRATLAIDGTVAGLAYRRERPHTGDGTVPGRQRLYLPMRDGVERIGVLELEGEVEGGEFNEETVAAAWRVATLLAELFISKMQYGDNLERARRQREMTLAAELRWSMTPPLFFAVPNASIACALEPAYDLAGDAVDYAMNGDLLHFAVFDAMGHGLEAARLANLAVAAYRHTRRLGGALEEVYEAVTSAIAEEFGPERFVTGLLAVLDTSIGEVTYVDAGHPRPVILRNSGLHSVDSGEVSLPFGIGREARAVSRLTLEPGDRFVVYSDGLVEARSVGGEHFGLDRLHDVITTSFSEAYSPAEAARRVMHAVVQHLGRAPEDDATLVMVSWERPGDARPEIAR